jgi:hypothetical protein
LKNSVLFTMPKYYVSIMQIREIVDAQSPVDACYIVSKKRSIISAGLSWKVSEVGFSEHEEDYHIPDLVINKEIKKRES